MNQDLAQYEDKFDEFRKKIKESDNVFDTINEIKKFCIDGKFLIRDVSTIFEKIFNVKQQNYGYVIWCLLGCDPSYIKVSEEEYNKIVKSFINECHNYSEEQIINHLIVMYDSDYEQRIKLNVISEYILNIKFNNPIELYEYFKHDATKQFFCWYDFRMAKIQPIVQDYLNIIIECIAQHFEIDTESATEIFHISVRPKSSVMDIAEVLSFNNKKLLLPIKN